MAAHSTACAAGWVRASRPDRRPPREFLKDSYAELSPDGIGHYDVVVAKLAAMHAREPGLTGADLREITPRTLVMVGDDDEVRLEHAIEMYRSLPTANSPSFPVPRMAC
jgi:pimeloyl-ACP methyl ester carboxylesterase